MLSVELDESQAGIKIARRNINNLRYANDTTLMARNEEEQKSFLMRVKEQCEKLDKTQHSKNQDHGSWPHQSVANGRGESGNRDKLYFLGPPNRCGQ